MPLRTVAVIQGSAATIGVLDVPRRRCGVEVTSEMVLKASAKLVGYAPIQTSSGQQTVDVSLSEDVLPGSVVILAPKLVRVAVHLDENSVTRPYIVLQPSEIRFAK